MDDNIIDLKYLQCKDEDLNIKNHRGHKLSICHHIFLALPVWGSLFILEQ